LSVCISKADTMNTPYRPLLAIATIVFCCYGLSSAQEIKRTLPFFDKIVVSPKINVVLVKGDKEGVRIVYSKVSEQKIHAHVSGKTLQLYLDGARIVEKRHYAPEDNYQHKVNMYRDASVTAYVTYTSLRKLVVRGEEAVSCNSMISGDEFILRAYGESKITLDSLNVTDFVIALYGENKLRVSHGSARQQTYRLYGENRIDNSGLNSETIFTSIYGEAKLRLYATNQVRITSFGEPQIEVSGSADIRKGLMVGRANITQVKGSN
jgi:hypothetical protein